MMTIRSRWAPPEGGALVLLNAIGCDERAWQWLAVDNAMMPSYPGHGRRPRQPSWTHEDIADDVVGAIEGPLDLVGVGLGGVVALKTLVRHPGRIRSALIACGGSVRRSEGHAEALRRTASARASSGREAGMSSAAEETVNRCFTPFAVRTGHPGVRYLRECVARMDAEAWSDVWMSLATASLISREEATGISAPVTLVGGAHDRSAGLEGLAELHRLIPRSRFEIVPAPHMIHLETPATLSASIERHFAWMPAGDRVEQPISSPGRRLLHG
jgi:3-oxoadipate enol-lactonase/3-oxoadipate enol-lactonase/4-carboxymuconolactone decarboxylase